MNTNAYLGLVGNGETAALIGPDLAIRWLCIPRFDGTPVFAGALDPRRGGGLSLRLADEAGRPLALAPEPQAYAGDTAVLRSAAAGGGWRVQALDYMPWGGHCLVREVEVTNRTGAAGAVRLQALMEPVRSVAFQVAVRTEAGVAAVTAPDGVLLAAWGAAPGASAPPGGGPGGAGEGAGAALGGTSGGAGEGAGAALEADLGVVAAGETRRLRLLLVYGPDASAARLGLAAAAGDAGPEAAAAFWAQWLGAARTVPGSVPPAWAAAYRRSLVVLKLLSYAPTGALLAAPTASFPAVPGGGDNWDYRFTWLRDGYYTAMTLDAAGLHDEARRFYDFCFSLQDEDGHWRQPLYTVDGADPAESAAPDLAGPGGEQPVRFGNAASGQLQLDNEGNVLHGLWFHYRTGGGRDALERHWDGVRRACRWTAANWERMESGIWEVRDYQSHWVHGKAMCYTALESGARIAGVLGRAAEAAAWRSIAARIRADVVERGWNPSRGAYLRHYGDGAPPPCVEISVLALVFYGLLSPRDPRILSTVALLEQEQSRGGLALGGGICRYDYAALPFYLPTLWLARYYLMAGRLSDCDRLIETCLDCATDLGLMAEHFDGPTRTQWGNFPQAFSHEELARLMLERAQGWSFHAWDQPAAGTDESRM